MLKSILKVCFKPLNIVNKILPKDDKLIFLYANLGFYDNVKALYDYLITKNYNEKYKIICACSDYKRYEVDEPPNVQFVSTKAGIKHFLKAKYAFYCFGKYPVKPGKNQAVVNLWHGVPLKKIGNMEDKYKNVDYDFFTHLLATSDFTADILQKCFSCDKEKIVICGQPRTDEMLIKDTSQGKDKLIVWLPTYREEELLEDNDILPIAGISGVDIGYLDEILNNKGCRMIIKLHPLQKGTIRKTCNNIFFITHDEMIKQGKTIYSILRKSDALITDYSSVYFDYLLLDRQIGFAVDDMDKYSRERGFTMTPPEKYMPGPVIRNKEHLEQFIKEISEGSDNYKDAREKLNNIINYYKDGNNCSRILDIVGIRKD